MKKTLRFLMMGALMLISGSAFAEDIIWQEDFSTFAKDSVPTGGTYKYVCKDGKSSTKIYEQALAGGTSPELLVSKNDGSFTATIPLNGKSGEMTLSYKANYDRLTVTATGATLGEKTNSGTTFMIPVTVEAGTSSVTFVFTNSNSSNARFDDVKLYQGVAKKAAGLSWGKASTTVTFGDESTYAYIPTLQNANNLAVTCTSTEPTVATVTNEGVITVVGVGETVISAVFEGNDEYEAQTVSVTITVKAGEREANALGGKNNPHTLATLIEEYQTNGSISGKIYIKGYVTDIIELSSEYGNVTFKMADTNDQDASIKLDVYRIKFLENKSFTAEDQLKVSDQVIVYGEVSVDETAGATLKNGYVYSLNGNTSNINTITVDAENAAVYNLNGQRMVKAQKGLYIVNGKKVMVK